MRSKSETVRRQSPFEPRKHHKRKEMKGLQLVTILCALIGFAACDGGRVVLNEFHRSRCLGKDGVFLAIPESCTQYLICVNGVAVLSTCGLNHFDARRSVCDTPSRAGCISFGPLPLPSLCLGHVDGDMLPVPGNRTNFYECMQEKTILQSCGSLQFDANTKRCVQPLPQPEVAPCFGVRNGIQLPVAGSSSQYYFCMNNKAFLKDCGNMHFDVKKAVCVVMLENESPSIEDPSSQQTAILPPQQLPNQYDPLAQQMCKNQRLGARVALPGTCSQYYVCMGNTGILKSCNLMQFNPITAACDLPSNVHCTIQPTGVVYGTQDSLSHSNPENSTADQVCYGQRDAMFLAAPGKCSDYYFCFRNRGYLKSCGRRHFSPITLSCVELDESNCVDVAPAAPVLQVLVPVANGCFSRDNGVLLRHPTECGMYLICDNYVAKEMLCPAGLHFNPERNYCDWPEMAKCI